MVSCQHDTFTEACCTRSIVQDKTAVYYTLGCKLNVSETSTIGKVLREAGVRTVRKGEKADICAVSYTHLDGYKRQVLIRNSLVDKNVRNQSYYN